MIQPVKIDSRLVGEGQPVFIIAEAGVNHNGDIELARKLVDAAKEAGADAVKFQTFTAEAIALKDAPKSTYHIETTGSEQSWYDLLRSQELTKEAHKILYDYCKKREIMFLSTPYDKASADLLEELGVPAFKIASTDTNNVPFLRHVARKGLPIILSTAMSTLEEVRESVDAIREEGNNSFILLHCTANYPAPLKDINLRAMTTLRDEFQVPVGYSDHTVGYFAPIAAVAAGASVFEKHFTLDKSLPGPDHRSSLDPSELATMIKDIRTTEVIMGTSEKKPSESEYENREKLRKSIVSRVDIPKGTVIIEEMLDVKRPGTGLSPKYWEKVIGRRAKVDIPQDKILAWDEIDVTAR